MLRSVTSADKSLQMRIPVSESKYLLPFKFYFPDSTYPKENVSIYIAVLEYLPRKDILIPGNRYF